MERLDTSERAKPAAVERGSAVSPPTTIRHVPSAVAAGRSPRPRRVLFVSSLGPQKLPFVDQQIYLLRRHGVEVRMISRLMSDGGGPNETLYSGFVNRPVSLLETALELVRARVRAAADKRYAAFIDAEAQWGEMGRWLGAKRAHRWNAVARAAADFRPDLIHVHFAWHLPNILPLAEYLQVPIVCTAHHSDIYFEEGWQETLSHPSVAQIVSISESVHGYMMEHCPQLEAKTTLIYNPLNPDFLEPATPPATGLRIVNVASFRPVKNQAWLVRGLAELKRRGTAFRCDFIGIGEEQAAVERQIAEAGLQDSTRFLGWRNHGDVLQAMDEASLFALTSRSEGLPTVVTEALARKRPVVATDIPSTRDASRNGAYARLVPIDDDMALADALEAAAADGARDDPLLEEARQWVLENFHPDVHYRLLSGVYRKVFE